MKLGSVSPLIVVPEGADPVKHRIEEVARLGLSAIGARIDERWEDKEYIRDVGELARERGVELLLRVSGDFYQEGEAAEQTIARWVEITRSNAQETGARIASVVSGPMLATHRWAPGKPLDERKRILATNFARLADGVASAGVTLAVENHCDWRGHELREIIEMAARPNLKVQIDTGNAFSVFEEPIDCARALAPYVASGHLKDVHVTPFATGTCLGTRAVSVPLGQGHVDNVEICRILRDQVSDPDGLALLIEPFYLPEGMEPGEFLRQSVDWARRELAELIA